MLLESNQRAKTFGTTVVGCVDKLMKVLSLHVLFCTDLNIDQKNEGENLFVVEVMEKISQRTEGSTLSINNVTD